jgi:hypothetical protein
MADSKDTPHHKTKLEELDTTAPYADRPEDPTATAILRKKKKPNVGNQSASRPQFCYDTNLYCRI